MKTIMRRATLFGNSVQQKRASVALLVAQQSPPAEQESIVKKMSGKAAKTPIVVKYTASGEWHGYSLESALKLRVVMDNDSTRAISSTAEFSVGVKVEHATRGRGVVINTDGNKKPVIVKFVNGEVHSYTQNSATKMTILLSDGTEQPITGISDLCVGHKVKHHVRGKGVIASLTGNLRAAVRCSNRTPTHNAP